MWCWSKLCHSCEAVRDPPQTSTPQPDMCCCHLYPFASSRFQKSSKPSNWNIFSVEGLFFFARFLVCLFEKQTTSWPLNEEILCPSGCNIRWLTIHLMRGTCKALPSYGALLKATTVAADFWNLLVTAALTRHVCTRPRYLRESVGRNKNTTHSYLPCAPCRDGFSFPLIINMFAPEPGKCKQKTPQTGPDVQHICIKGRLDLNVNFLTRIFSSQQLP